MPRKKTETFEIVITRGMLKELIEKEAVTTTVTEPGETTEEKLDIPDDAELNQNGLPSKYKELSGYDNKTYRSTKRLDDVAVVTVRWEEEKDI